MGADGRINLNARTCVGFPWMEGQETATLLAAGQPRTPMVPDGVRIS